MISAAALSMFRVVAGYIDHTSEEMVVAYAQARENCCGTGAPPGRRGSVTCWRAGGSM
jgi:hypothetical protein